MVIDVTPPLPQCRVGFSPPCQKNMNHPQTPSDRPFTCEGTPSAPGTFIESTGTARDWTSTTACKASDIMTKGDAKYNFLVHTLLPDALDFFTNALSVLPVTSSLYWPLGRNVPWSDSQCISPGNYIRPFVCCNYTLPRSGRAPGGWKGSKLCPRSLQGCLSTVGVRVERHWQPPLLSRM